MLNQELLEKVCAVAAKACNADAATVTAETLWREELNMKSVYAMKVCALLKVKTGADITPTDLGTCQTIADTVALVESRL